MFAGLGAFPLTPRADERVDEAAFAGLMKRLVEARVDSVTAFDSTGSYAYLCRPERARVAQLAVVHAGRVPIIVGIGSLRTTDVLRHAEDAQAVGAAPARWGRPRHLDCELTTIKTEGGLSASDCSAPGLVNQINPCRTLSPLPLLRPVQPVLYLDRCHSAGRPRTARESVDSRGSPMCAISTGTATA